MIVSGLDCVVYSGGYNPALDDLVIKGNLIVSGMNCRVGNVVQLKGQVRNSGIRCQIN